MANPSYETANGILSAARELGLDDASLHQLPGYRARAVLDRVFDTFTRKGRGGRDRYWIWDDLRGPTFVLPQPQSFDMVLALGPGTTPVWLIVEDFDNSKKGPPFWVFEASLAAAVATLKNHHLLEFYLVSRRIDWLVGENHHDVLFAAGAHAIAVLQGIAG